MVHEHVQTQAHSSSSSGGGSGAMSSGVTTSTYGRRSSSNSNNGNHFDFGNRTEGTNGTITTYGSAGGENADCFDDGLDGGGWTPKSGPGPEAGPEGSWQHNRTWITSSSRSADDNDGQNTESSRSGSGSEIHQENFYLASDSKRPLLPFPLPSQHSVLSTPSDEGTGGGYVTALTSPVITSVGIMDEIFDVQTLARMTREESEAEILAFGEKYEEQKSSDVTGIITKKQKNVVFMGSDVSALIGLTLMQEKPYLLKKVVCVCLTIRPSMDGAFKVLLTSMRFCGMGSFLAKREKEKEKEKKADRHSITAAVVASDHTVYWDRLRYYIPPPLLSSTYLSLSLYPSLILLLLLSLFHSLSISSLFLYSCPPFLDSAPALSIQISFYLLFLDLTIINLIFAFNLQYDQLHFIDDFCLTCSPLLYLSSPLSLLSYFLHLYLHLILGVCSATLHYTALHYTTLHCTTLHYTSSATITSV